MMRNVVNYGFCFVFFYAPAKLTGITEWTWPESILFSVWLKFASNFGQKYGNSFILMKFIINEGLVLTQKEDRKSGVLSWELCSPQYMWVSRRSSALTLNEVILFKSPFLKSITHFILWIFPFIKHENGQIPTCIFQCRHPGSHI